MRNGNVCEARDIRDCRLDLRALHGSAEVYQDVGDHVNDGAASPQITAAVKGGRSSKSPLLVASTDLQLLSRSWNATPILQAFLGSDTLAVRATGRHQTSRCKHARTVTKKGKATSSSNVNTNKYL